MRAPLVAGLLVLASSAGAQNAVFDSTGTFERVFNMGSMETGMSTTITYWLRTGDGRYWHLHFAPGQEPTLFNMASAHVVGTQPALSDSPVERPSAGDVLVASMEAYAAPGPGGAPASILDGNNLGDRTIIVIFRSNPDELQLGESREVFPGDPRWEWIFGSGAGAARSLVDYIKDDSYGQLRLTGRVFIAADGNAADAVWNQHPGNNFSMTVGFTPWNAGGGFQAQLQTFVTGIAIHELGHCFSMNHANALANCTDEAGNPVNIARDPVHRCHSIGYGDGWDPMGSHGVSHYSAFHKQLVGWIPDANVAEAKSDASFTLSPVESPLDGRLKAVKIFKPSADAYYWIDYRADAGPAVQIRLAIRMRPDPGTLDSANDSQLVVGALKDGTTFKDAGDGISITANGGGAISVHFGTPVVVTPPSPPVIDSALSAVATVGAPFSYQIAATNNPRSFGASGLPVGLTVNTMTGVISGTPSGAGGTFSVLLSAQNDGGKGTATLALTVNVAPPPACSLPAPSAPTFTPVSATAATLAWQPPAGAVSQSLYVAANPIAVAAGCPNPGDCLLRQENIAAGQASFSLTALSARTHYYTRVVVVQSASCRTEATSDSIWPRIVQFDWNFAGATSGSHPLKVRAYSATGYADASVVVNLPATIPTGPPSVVLSAPADGAAVSSIQAQAQVCPGAGGGVVLYDGDTPVATGIRAP